MFLAPKNFLGGSPEILDRDYKTEHSSEHRAKFCGDRPMKLGDYVREKRKIKNKYQQNISPPENYCSN